MTGRTDWFDLPVKDMADAMSFYEGLFGWSYCQMDDSPLADYVMIDAGGHLIGGLRKVKSSSPAPLGSAPIIYFTVERLQAAVQRARDLGAEIIGTPVDLGKGRGQYQWLRDRGGHLIGIWANQS